MNRDKVLIGIVLLLLLCSCGQAESEREHQITETGMRAEKIFPSPDDSIENPEEAAGWLEGTSQIRGKRLFSGYDQELSEFLSLPNIAAECRKEGPEIWNTTVSLADLTADGVPEVLISLVKGGVSTGDLEGDTTLYDLRTGEKIFSFYMGDPAVYGDTLQGYRDQNGRVHYVAASYMARSAETYVEDILIQDITYKNGVFFNKFAFAFRLRGGSMLDGEIAGNENERFGFYHKNFVFRDLTEEQSVLFLPYSQSEVRRTKKLEKTLKASSPYEYMKYLSSMTPVRTPWEIAGRFGNLPGEELVFVPVPGFEGVAEAIGDTYAVQMEAAEENVCQSQRVEAWPQPEEKLSETENRLEAFLRRTEIEAIRKKTEGKKEKITVSLTDLTGDGVPEALLTEGTGEQAETTLYDLDTGEELLRIPAFDPEEDAMFRYQDKKGAMGCKLAERIEQKNGAVDEIYRDLKYQNGRFVLTEENAFKSVTGLEWDGKAVRYLPFLLGKETKRETFRKAAGNKRILKLLEKHDMDTEGMEAFVRRAGETCFLPPDIRPAGILVDGRYQKIK